MSEPHVQEIWVLAETPAQAQAVVALLETGIPEVHMCGVLMLHHPTEEIALRALSAARSWMLPSGPERKMAGRMRPYPKFTMLPPDPDG